MDPCAAKPPSYYCPALSTAGNLVCAQCTAAGCVCLAPSTVAVATVAYVPPKTTVPPSLKLLGTGSVAVATDASGAAVSIMIHVLNVSSVWVDPGVVATDPAV